MKGITMIHVKRLVCLLLIFIMAFSCVNCGTPEAAGTDPPATEPGHTEATESTVAGNENQGDASGETEPISDSSGEATDPTETTPATEANPTTPADDPTEETTGSSIGETDPATEPTEGNSTETTSPAIVPPTISPTVTEPTSAVTGESVPTETEASTPTEPQETEPSHSHIYSVSKTVAPGCESRGYTVYKCSCGDSYNGNYTAALGHSYSVSQKVSPGCKSQGYTVYKCSCGASYKDDYVAAVGHSWGAWVTTKEPSVAAEGQETRTCSVCSEGETRSVAKLPAAVIDTAALEAYGRQYGANTHGYEVCVGIRAGYFPAYYCIITSMDNGYTAVQECIDDTTSALIAAGYNIYQEFEGHIGRIRLDVEVVHDHDNVYYVTVYYG